MIPNSDPLNLGDVPALVQATIDGPDATVVLPSGRELTAAEVRAVAADLADITDGEVPA